MKRSIAYACLLLCFNLGASAQGPVELDPEQSVQVIVTNCDEDHYRDLKISNTGSSTQTITAKCIPKVCVAEEIGSITGFKYFIKLDRGYQPVSDVLKNKAAAKEKIAELIESKVCAKGSPRFGFGY